MFIKLGVTDLRGSAEQAFKQTRFYVSPRHFGQ